MLILYHSHVFIARYLDSTKPPINVLLNDEIALAQSVRTPRPHTCPRDSHVTCLAREYFGRFWAEIVTQGVTTPFGCG
eukprot:scaffold182653_cov33-Tisochrysis_lutea.AAC.2